jgi:hypothetical protein
VSSIERREWTRAGTAASLGYKRPEINDPCLLRTHKLRRNYRQTNHSFNINKESVVDYICGLFNVAFKWPDYSATND